MHQRDFASRWRARFKLPARGWRKSVDEHLATLPFVDRDAAGDLIVFLFADLPGLLGKKKDSQTLEMAEAFAWVCFAFWQCESAFPAFPENYAEFLKSALLAGRSDEAAVALARMIIDGSHENGRCGFNYLQPAHPELILESEALVHEGEYELYLRAKEKYDEYELYLAQSAGFWEDWERIKRLFPRPTGGDRILRRTSIPERNWVRGAGAKFQRGADRFQALFDFFCWKYFLWGMHGDKPLLMKASVVFTPYGTQLFIPGYLSFDSKRDLDLARISKLHRARGITRQGPAFSIGRRELADLKRKAREADRQAKNAGLRGNARYRFVAKATAFRDTEDFRRTRKILEN